MGQRVFISFLGIGPNGEGYSELDYQMEGKSSSISTDFVQRAEIEFLGKDSFDKIYILCTKESYKYFFHDLCDELKDNLGIGGEKIECVQIDKIEKTDHAWKLFNKISHLINPGDSLVFDFTHGFRSLSIILSTALNFILKTKTHVTLEHVFYGQESFSDDGTGFIIDMKDFYIINEWADGVSRLVENADASKLTDLAHCDTNLYFNRLDDENLINALQNLTDTLRNIDVNRIADMTKYALDIIKMFLVESTGAEKELLKLVENKFQSLAVESSGKYDIDYYLLQIEIIKMLLEHKLFMQAFTVMRELVGSIGMLGAPDNYTENMKDNNTADNRPHYADLFVKMIEISEKKFSVGEKKKERSIELRNSIYMQINETGLLEKFKSSTKKLLKVRNGFDHAWTGKGDRAVDKIGDFKIIADEAVEVLDKLVGVLIENNIIR